MGKKLINTDEELIKSVGMDSVYSKPTASQALEIKEMDMNGYINPELKFVSEIIKTIPSILEAIGKTERETKLAIVQSDMKSKDRRKTLETIECNKTEKHKKTVDGFVAITVIVALATTAISYIFGKK